MFDVFYLGRRPNLFAHEQPAESIQHAQHLSRTRYCWVVTYLADYDQWDWLWEPLPWQSHFTHVWPSQWHDYSGTYLVPKTGDIQFHFQPGTITSVSHEQDFKKLITDIDFDWSWTPHPMDPPYIYVFGNQWHRAEVMPTVELAMAGAVERKFMPEPKARLLPCADRNWKKLIDCEFDFSWRPDPGDPAYIYVFGNQWHASEKMPTVEYHVPGATTRKFMTHPRARLLPDLSAWNVPDGIDTAGMDFSWVPDPGSPPYIYEFGTQWQKTGGPRYCVPGAEHRKFVSSPRVIKIIRDTNWEIPKGAVYDEDFDWTWHPDATETPYIYQFGTQHQKTGGPVYRVPGATEVKYVDQIRVTVKAAAAPVYIIDHIDGYATKVREEIGQAAEIIKTVRYVDNYLDTLRRLAANVDHSVEYVWICSTVCDYTDFDFTWYPEQWQATMLHVFASGDEKFGDTFFMHVPTFRVRSETCQLLDWYDVNFVEDISVPRRPMPAITHQDDCHVEQVRSACWLGPLALFSNTEHIADTDVVVPLWREKTKTIVPLTEGATAVIVPRSAVPYVKTQLYDYSHIDRTQRKHQDDPLDIVFISNGETGADHHFQVLQQVLRDNHARNQLHRSDGVKGRVAAYQAAAEKSRSAWFFAVFAKLQVNSDFDWGWQPDRMQQPKHYIFHAYNPVNHLTYGHQAMIAYNVAMTMSNTGQGLDFTLDQPHEVVPMVSGTAYYDNDPWTCWRTAFREAIKLRHSLPDVENEYRLAAWLSTGHGVNGHWSMRGARDAVCYYDEVGGDFAEIKKTYEWSWLAAYAMMVQPELVTQSRT